MDRKKFSSSLLVPFLALTFGLLIATGGLFGDQSKDSAKHHDFFPVSVWYTGGTVRAPMIEPVTKKSRAEWKKDLEQIKKLGFNTVRCWLEWAYNEKEEGKYDFSSLQLLTDLAAEVGLKVICQVYIDSAPEWVGQKYPDSAFVASNDLKVHSQSSPGFCFDHPGVQEKILNFFSAAARAVKNKPAFYGWDLWSEPHIINWSEVYHLGDLRYVQFCYCPSSQARFREWLEKKYATIDQLNQAWHRTYRSFEEVEPPRFGTILTYTDYVDWQEYISDKLAEDLALKARAIKKVFPESVVTSHSAIPGLFSRPSWDGTPDDRKMNDSVDYYGVSIYPKHAGAVRPWSPFFRAAGLDFVRSMSLKNEGFYVGELQAGYGVFGMKVSVPVTAADLRDWMWSMVAYGARAINIYAYYPMSSGYEAGGYGLIELDGKITPRAEEAGRIARTISQNLSLFLKARPQSSPIAIVYNPLSHLVGGQQTFTSEGQPVGYNNLSESLQGVHRAFFERGLKVDFIHVRDLKEKAASYRLIIVPYPVMISQPYVQDLIRYVEQGGNLLIEARAGWIDEKGFAFPIIPGGGLDRVLGCREARLLPIQKTGQMTISQSHPALPWLKPGEALDTVFFEETFEITDKKAQVLATSPDGQPMLVLAPHGKGQAIIAGSFLGSAYHHFRNPNNGKFLAGLAEWLGLKPELELESRPENSIVEWRMLEGPDHRLLFVFNRGEEKATAFLAAGFPWPKIELKNLETGEKISFKQNQNRLSFNLELEPQGVVVILARKS
ncbi:MAG: beta-galactosidase [Candidatus Saccharicenans sp.]|uniref:beta-galactosidase n=1 Tax=Candidatus Saccharicenans sp. TaxID=2819258 RepID=UPI00404B00F4